MYKVVSYADWNALPEIFINFREAKEKEVEAGENYCVEKWNKRGAVVVFNRSAWSKAGAWKMTTSFKPTWRKNDKNNKN